MKKFIKGRWFPFSLLLAGLVVVLLVGLWRGFRITYSPTLENSWSAISGVADWVGVIISILSAIASFMAVWYAIRVADKQNQITLFEKKYELFEIVFNCKIFSDSIKDVKNNIDVRMTFLAALCYNSIDGSKITDTAFVLVEQIAVLQKLKQISFLYENTDVLDKSPQLIDALSELMAGCHDDDKEQDLRERKQKFSDYTNSEEYKKLVDAMQKELMIK